MQVRIIPPKNLYVPVIPIRIPGDKRLLFALCHKCAKQFINKNTLAYDSYKCEHTDEERVSGIEYSCDLLKVYGQIRNLSAHRQHKFENKYERIQAFTATTTTLELKEAMEKGYKVTDLYRSWYWEEWTEIVFRGYMQKFLKVKL